MKTRITSLLTLALAAAFTIGCSEEKPAPTEQPKGPVVKAAATPTKAGGKAKRRPKEMGSFMGPEGVVD